MAGLTCHVLRQKYLCCAECITVFFSNYLSFCINMARKPLHNLVHNVHACVYDFHDKHKLSAHVHIIRVALHLCNRAACIIAI